MTTGSWHARRVDAGGQPGEDGYEVALRSPLIVLAVVDATRPVQWLAKQLIADFPAERFIGIVTADDPDDMSAVLGGLAPQLAEVIFTAATSPTAIPGDMLAMQVLERAGMGQDFVFSVPLLPDAISYGVGVLAEDQHRGWVGTALLVTGSAAAVREARQAVAMLDAEGSRRRPRTTTL